MKICLTSSSPEATREIGSKLGRLCQKADWLGLTGELGAGKTCLVQGLALGVGVDPAVAVVSPTFIIHRTYPGRIPLHHLDLYRLDSIEELTEIGYGELVEGDGAVVVEWCERIPESMPGRGVVARLEILDEECRRIEMQGLDERGREWLRGLDPGK